MFAKIENGQVIEYPANPRMDNPNVSLAKDWVGGTINGNTYVSVTKTTKLSSNISYSVVEGTPVYNSGNGVCTQTWTQVLRAKDDIKNEITQKRFRKEIGGITYNGDKYYTDRESQTKYIAVAVDLSQIANLDSYIINWKAENSGNAVFRTLDGNTMLSIINTVRSHVQACYDKEFEYHTLVDTANNTVLSSTDFDAGWPSNV